jgi:hypothetical protein
MGSGDIERATLDSKAESEESSNLTVPKDKVVIFEALSSLTFPVLKIA